MRQLKILLCISLVLLAQPGLAQETPFKRGVNLTNWFQAPSAQRIQFERYTRKDFEQIRNLGADVIRLPINLHFMTSGAPDYTLDPLFLRHLDEVVGWAEALGLHLILDNHTFDPAESTDPAVGEVLEKVWLQMAQHYKDRYALLYYEVLNEPHGIADDTWNDIQQAVVAAIRTVDTSHTIIIGGASWNSYTSLAAMPVYADDNLIYTFHFYDPFVFTHQGASWVDPSMVPLAGVPFPYRAADMPPLPPSLQGSWVGSAHGNYANDGTVAKVQELLDIALAFRAERGVPIFLGELGVLMTNAADADRVAWYRAVREYLDEHEVSWTAWDYHGGFGLFKQGSPGRYEHDLNLPLLEALGFNLPPQTSFVAPPETVGFALYEDRVADGLVEASYTAGDLDLANRDRPYQGSQAIRWQGAAQFDALGFDFRPQRDLGFLAGSDYRLELAVRCTSPGSRLGLRFMDSDTGDPNDHPWRMGVTLDSDSLVCNGQWQQLGFPLAELEEQGAWDDNTWYPAQGDFNWSEIDRFELVSEDSLPAGASFGFDRLRVTRLQPGPPRLSQAAGMNGLFYDPATPGHGFDFNQLEAGLVVYYYGHTAGGERLWLISGLYRGELRFDSPLALDFYELPEGSFGQPSTEGLDPWGSITLTLHSCNSARAQFDGFDGQLDMQLTRLAGVTGLVCDSD